MSLCDPSEWALVRSAVLTGIPQILANQGKIMATLQQLATLASNIQAQNATLTQDVASLVTASQNMIAAYNALVASGGLTPAQQTLLDTAVAGLTTALAQEQTADTSVEAQTAALIAATPAASAPASSGTSSTSSAAKPAAGSSTSPTTA